MAMIDDRAQGLTFGLPLVTEAEDLAARRALRAQVTRLERQLADTLISAFPRAGVAVQVPATGGPRLLSLGELEALRDDLAERIAEARRTLRDRGYVERKNRNRVEAMIADPARFKWVRISNEDIGEPGCKFWHSRPRLVLIGMLMGWWQVKISSGCP